MKCYNRTSQEELKYEALHDKNQDSKYDTPHWE
jgi:hypothetical protein